MTLKEDLIVCRNSNKAGEHDRSRASRNATGAMGSEVEEHRLRQRDDIKVLRPPMRS